MFAVIFICGNLFLLIAGKIAKISCHTVFEKISFVRKSILQEMENQGDYPGDSDSNLETRRNSSKSGVSRIMRESWQPWDVSVGFRRPSSPYKALEICVKRFSEYLAYEILHRPDSCQCVCIFIFFHLPDSRLSVLNGLHLCFWLRGSENQEFSTNGTTQTAELTVLNTRLDSCWPLEWKRFITWINYPN